MNWIKNLFCCCFRFCQKRNNFENHSSSMRVCVYSPHLQKLIWVPRCPSVKDPDCVLDRHGDEAAAEAEAALDVEAFMNNFLAWVEQNEQPLDEQNEQPPDMMEDIFDEGIWSDTE
jgi:hypothetical protein